MNPNQFQHMGQARTQSMDQQPMGMQKNGGSSSSDIRNQIFKTLSSYPVPTGWQQTVTVHQRIPQIHQMVTGLLILKPEMALAGAVNVAVGFETAEFKNSADQNTYTLRLNQKMSEIHRTRQQHANQQQQQFQNHHTTQMGISQQQIQAQQMALNQSQYLQGFGAPQPQQIGQVGAVPMQQQFTQQQRTGNPNGMQPQQQLQNGQPIQGIPRPMPQNRGQPQFTPQEQQHIMNMARQMAANLSPQDRQGLQAQVQRLTPQQHQVMQAQGINPAEHLIRNLATKKYHEERNKRQQLGGQLPIQQREGTIANQGRPASRLAVRGQGQLATQSAGPQVDPAFAPANTDQFLGQQAEALRHQEAGQVVVPASHGQGPPPQVRGSSHLSQPGQYGVNRATQPQTNFQIQGQAFWNNPQPPPQNLQQPQTQSQGPALNVVNMHPQAPQQNGLHGQVGGLGNGQAHRTPQQMHNMPTLNQPLEQTGHKQKDQMPRNMQSTPKPNQRGAPAVSNQPQPTAASAQSAGTQTGIQSTLTQAQMNALPENIRAKLLTMPESQRKPWIQAMMQKQQQLQQRQQPNNNNTSNATKPGNVGQPNPQSVPNAVSGGQGINVQPPIGPVATTTQTPSMVSSSAGQNGNQQPLQGGGDRPPQARVMPIRLTPEQNQYMDNLPFPPQIINRNSYLGNIPDNIQSWRQLKAFVHQSAQTLPPGSLQKVIGLQSIHFQMQNPAHQQRPQASFQGQSNIPQIPQTAVAPLSQMVPPQTNQGGRQTGPPGTSQFGLPNLPEPTAQELQGARNSLPPNMRSLPNDDQLRAMIRSKRQQDFLKTPQGQQALALHQRRSAMVLAQGPDAHLNSSAQLPLDTQPMQHPGRSQSHQQHSTQQQQPAPNSKTSRLNPGLLTGSKSDLLQGNQKGMKRISTDDVIEVPDPSLVQQSRLPPSSKGPELSQTGNSMPKITTEQLAKLSPEQRAQLQRRFQAFQAAQRGSVQQNGPGAPPARTAGNFNKNATFNPQEKLHQLMAEVAQSPPPRQIVPMSPQTRSTMVEKLKEATGNMLARLEQSIPHFLQVYKDENKVKELLRMRSHLIAQARDKQFAQPVDNFTMSLKQLEEYKAKMHQYFSFMMEKGGQLNQARVYQPPQQLNAANLQQQQDAINLQRAASVQRSHANSNRAPAAPTTTHAPFPLTSLSPSGVPQIYASKNELTQEKLVLPVSKKRKNNNNPTSAASTPAYSKGTPVTKSSPLPKPASPDVQRTKATISLMKCLEEGCTTGGAGFATKDELEKHYSEAHDPTQNIKDPTEAAEYAIESLREVLGLDENGNCKPVAPETKQEKAVSQAPVMKSTVSSQGIKQEVSTPMSRNPTQTGPSPSAALLKTPQNTSSVKTPNSDTKSLVREVIANVASGSNNTVPAAAVESDGWANSKVDKTWFSAVYGGLTNLNRSVGTEAMTAYLQRNPFTPSTTPSSAAKDSPDRTDISPRDDLNVSINVQAGEPGELEDDWVLTHDWFDDDLQSDMADLTLPNLEDIMEWQKTFANDDEDLEDEKLNDNEWGAPVEFLKAHDPEKYEALKKKQKEREARVKR